LGIAAFAATAQPHSATADAAARRFPGFVAIPFSFYSDSWLGSASYPAFLIARAIAAGEVLAGS
jgi:hypothetical protein